MQGTSHVRKLLIELQMVFSVITCKVFDGFRRILRVASGLAEKFRYWVMPLVAQYLSLS